MRGRGCEGEEGKRRRRSGVCYPQPQAASRFGSSATPPLACGGSPVCPTRQLSSSPALYPTAAMAKAKGKKGGPGGGPSHLRARLEYLYKAAAYIQSASTGRTVPDVTVKPSVGEQQQQQQQQDDATPQKAPRTVPNIVNAPDVAKNEHVKQQGITTTATTRTLCLPRQYISQMRGVSLKSQLRLPVDVKRSLCKRCEILLVPGFNCTETIENRSRDGKKPWADVLVVRCTACGTVKRFPQNAKRSKKLSERRKEAEEKKKKEEDEAQSAAGP